MDEEVYSESYLRESFRILIEFKYEILANAAKWADDNGASEHEKCVLKNCSEFFSHDLHELLDAITSVNNKDLQLEITHRLSIVIQSAYYLGNLGKNNQFAEKRLKIARKTQTAPARKARNLTIPSKKAEIVATHAKALWRTNPIRIGNAQGTARDIAEIVMAAWKEVGIPNAEFGNAKDHKNAIEFIRKFVPKVDGWRSREKVETQNCAPQKKGNTVL